MPVWGWIVIVVALALVALAVALWHVASRRRSDALQRRFGPEYDRAVQEHGKRGDAEEELSDRLRRRKELDIRALPDAARERHLGEWREVQAQFVDAPATAVANAQSLVTTVMAERGYPVEDFEQRVADVSVDHPHVVENYRAAHAIADRAAEGNADTEELRQAMKHYRALFDELLGAGADEPLRRDTSEAAQEEARSR
jgi:hypothetical protein